MPGPIHQNQKPADGIHSIHAYDPPDKATRDGIAQAATDMGKVALQLDFLRLYVALGVVGLWRRLGDISMTNFVIDSSGDGDFPDIATAFADARVLAATASNPVTIGFRPQVGSSYAWPVALNWPANVHLQNASIAGEAVFIDGTALVSTAGRRSANGLFFFNSAYVGPAIENSGGTVTFYNCFVDGNSGAGGDPMIEQNSGVTVFYNTQAQYLSAGNPNPVLQINGGLFAGYGGSAFTHADFVTPAIECNAGTGNFTWASINGPVSQSGGTLFFTECHCQPFDPTFYRGTGGTVEIAEGVIEATGVGTPIFDGTGTVILGEVSLPDIAPTGRVLATTLGVIYHAMHLKREISQPDIITGLTHTMGADRHLRLDSTANAITVTLPDGAADVSDGELVWIEDIGTASTNPQTIVAAAGDTIEGVAAPGGVVFSADYSHALFRYDKASAQWLTLFFKDASAGAGGSFGNEQVFGARGISFAADSRYLWPGYSHDNGEVTLIEKPVVRAGTMQNLRIVHNVVGSGGTGIDYIVTKNGVETALKVPAMAASASTGSDLVNTVAVAAGDTIGVKATKLSGLVSSPDRITASFEIV